MQGQTTTPQENGWFSSWGYYVGNYAAEAEKVLKDPRMMGSVASATNEEMAAVEAARDNVKNAFPKETKYSEDKHVKTAKLLLVKVDGALADAQQGVWSRKAEEIRTRTPAMTEVVKDAAKSEEELMKKLETAREAVRKALPHKPSEDDLASAEDLLKEAASALTAVNEAIVQRQLRDRANVIVTDKVLMEDAVPGASGDDKALSDKVAEVREAAKKALTADGPLTGEGVEGEKGKVQQALKDLQDAVTKRINTAKAIREDASMKTPPEAKTDLERKLRETLSEAQTKVRDALPQYPTAQDISAAEKLLAADVNPTLVKLKAEIEARTKRQEEAKKIRDHGDMTKTIVEGATADETEAVTGPRKVLLNLVPKDGAPAPEDVKKAKELLIQVTQALAAAVDGVKARKQRQEQAQKIRGHGDMTRKIADGANADEVSAVEKARDAVRNVLLPIDVAPAEKAIKDASSLLPKVKEALEAATTGVAARRQRQKRAMEIRSNPQLTQEAAKGAEEEEIKLVKEAQVAVVNALPKEGAPTLEALAEAEKLLLKVKDALDAATNAVAAREQRQERAAEIRKNPQLTQAAAKGADANEIRLVKEAQDAVRNALPTEGTPTPDALQEAERLLLEVKKALDDATLGVKTRQEGRVNEITVTGGHAVERLKGIVGVEVLANAVDTFGDASLVGGLIKGCDRGHGRFTAVMEKFKGDPNQANLKALLTKGGFAGRPDVLAHLLDSTFTAQSEARKGELKKAALNPNASINLNPNQQKAADAVALEQFTKLVDAFANDTEAPQRLEKLLAAGGLDQDPKFLGDLLQNGFNGDAAQLVKLTKEFAQPKDLAELKGLMVDGGLGKDPRMLAALLKDGCGGDAAKLKKLTSGYPAPDPEKVQQGDPAALADQKHLQNLKNLVEVGGLGDKPATLAEILKIAFDAADNASDLANFKNLIENGGLGDRPKVAANLLTVGCSGNPARVKRLAAQFSHPTDQANLKGLLAHGGLDHKPEILGDVLRQVGGNDPPGVMRALAAEFQGDADRANLKGLIVEGGLGGKPAILGAVLGIGCEGKPDKLKALTTAYETGQPTSPQDLQNLKGLLENGGLADDPVAFGHLYATGCDGSADKLKQVEQTFRPDPSKLKGLLQGGGMGGARLGNVLKTTFTGNPTKLVTLHDAFAADLPGLKKIADAFDGGPGPGERLKRVLGHLKGNGTEAAAIAALNGTFLVKMQGKEHLMSEAAKFQINRGAINSRPNGIPPATLATASDASTDAGDDADSAADEADNAANGNQNIEKTAQETRKAATAAKNAAANAATVNLKTGELQVLRNNPPRLPPQPGNALGEIDLAELNSQSQAINNDLNNACAQLSQQMADAKAAAAEVKVALEAAKADLKKAQEALALQPDDAGLTQSVQELTTGVQMAQQAYGAAAAAAAAAQAVKKAVALRDVRKADMDHICGRHTYWKQFTTEGLDDVQSMYPEGTTDAQVAAYVDEALDALFDDNTAIPTSASILGEPDGKVAKTIYLPKSRFTVRVVFKRIPTNGKIEIRTCFPTSLGTISRSDMETIKQALGK